MFKKQSFFDMLFGYVEISRISFCLRQEAFVMTDTLLKELGHGG